VRGGGGWGPGGRCLQAGGDMNEYGGDAVGKVERGHREIVLGVHPSSVDGKGLLRRDEHWLELANFNPLDPHQPLRRR
jgi:hypothetical protein